MEIFGITGGIGMGKSTAGEILRELGICVVDTDQLARELVAPGTPGLAEVLGEFGPEYSDAHGALRRDALGRRVFADAAALARLNAILHPRIRSAWQTQLVVWRQAGIVRAAVTIPLLYESGCEAEFNWIACLACTGPTQLHRLRQRGWSDTDIDRRITAQLPVAEKMRRAHRVIWTEGTLGVHTAQWRRVIATPPALFKAAPPV